MTEIEKGVPFTGEIITRVSYRWRQMEVGDSFTVPYNKAPSVRAAARHMSKRSGMVFSTRQFMKDGEMIIRVWRVS